MGFENCLNIN